MLIEQMTYFINFFYSTCSSFLRVTNVARPLLVLYLQDTRDDYKHYVCRMQELAM